MKPRQAASLIGQQFGRWTVISRETTRRGTYWNCRCECGCERDVRGSALVAGLSRSCGCLSDEMGYRRNVIHEGYAGDVESSMHMTWRGMLRRCCDPTNEQYPRYGGRGITVVDRWLGKDGYRHFLDDMGPRPTPSHSIDRINNDGNYEPGNCHWATKTEQSRNRRNVVKIQYGGEALTLREMAERIGISYGQMWRGWKYKTLGVLIVQQGPP